MREIVFDTETTGLSFSGGDRMVEIGCVELVNRVPTGASFHGYFNPQRAMPVEAFNVHGLSETFLSDKPCFHERCEELLDFIGDSPLVAHNAGFDFGFLNGELGICGKPHVHGDRMVDTLSIARVKHPGAKHTLDALCTRYGIDLSQRTLHGALLDAQLLAQVYIELTGGRQITLGLAVDAEPARDAPLQAPARGQTRPMRHFAASEEELARHVSFLEKISEPLWGKAPS
ncbi:DNA polymerase III subunit epsilon [Stakelama tenebrarum]|uniref:DNA polymerase III subunit epsilon n=1 Tax=Stakelama tenebrarum TaxID=2711215 RepID=A0A6G6Y0T3_9SPHN|nr:DNA polymerase III subunit epsilon [Sphingosinithalassobacter tenebrarum]QIG78535.1 DNA polymerase III subunit epsilon [Sphingosinithalassobacter tenebrarum]